MSPTTSPNVVKCRHVAQTTLNVAANVAKCRQMSPNEIYECYEVVCLGDMATFGDIWRHFGDICGDILTTLETFGDIECRQRHRQMSSNVAKCRQLSLMSPCIEGSQMSMATSADIETCRQRHLGCLNVADDVAKCRQMSPCRRNDEQCRRQCRQMSPNVANVVVNPMISNVVGGIGRH